jgi:crotonobetainyl-CoA:carnitine CoA-transferase CaiB-like acyl-CoA transferase
MMTYPSDFASDPQFVARRYPRTALQPEIGELSFEGPAFLSTSIADPLVSRAPKLGEHTREICKDLLAMTDEEIDKLIADGALEEPRG